MMSTIGDIKKIEELLDGEDEGMAKMDGFDDCIIGVCERYGQERILAYDRNKVMEKLMETMTEEEAFEYFSFNQIGSWVGDRTPCFIVLP